MAEKTYGSFPRRKVKVRVLQGGGETVDYGRAPLFGIFRDGRRVYLPPADAPGIPEDEARRVAENVGGEVIQLWDPQDAA